MYIPHDATYHANFIRDKTRLNESTDAWSGLN